MRKLVMSLRKKIAKFLWAIPRHALLHSKSILQIGLGVLLCVTGGPIVGIPLIIWAVGNIVAPYLPKILKFINKRFGKDNKNRPINQKNSSNLAQKKSFENNNQINANGKTLNSIKSAYEKQTKNQATKNENGTLTVSFKTKEEEFEFFEKMARQGHEFTVKNSKGKIVGRATGGIYSKVSAVNEANRHLNSELPSRPKTSVKPDDKRAEDSVNQQKPKLGAREMREALNGFRNPKLDARSHPLATP
jgi:hypothetical protein